jgi:hypothetical protein
MSCGRDFVSLSFVTGRGFAPSASTSHRFSTPLRSLKGYAPPIGEKRLLSNEIAGDSPPRLLQEG